MKLKCEPSRYETENERFKRERERERDSVNE